MLTASWCLLLLSSKSACAHALGEHYVFIDVHETYIEGRFEIHFDDLIGKLGMAPPFDGASAQEMAQAWAPEVHTYIDDHYSMRAGDSELTLEFERADAIELPQGVYAQFFFRALADPTPQILVVDDQMLFEEDKLHRGLLLLNYNARTGESLGKEYTALIFSPSSEPKTLDLNNVPGLLRPRQFIWQGVLHIWIGIDHILFLVALILPSVLNRREGVWVAVSSFREAGWHIIKIVTLFTIAHSITLYLASMDIISLSSRLVESVIAASIVAVAANNLIHYLNERSVVLIFGFGLFHGLGFASVMGALPFRMVDLLKVVLAFNIGVELGQIAIVAVCFPILFALRHWRGYIPVILITGSVMVGVVALYWFIQRAFYF